MKNFYVITNNTKDKTNEVATQIKKYIEAKGGQCYLASQEELVPEGIECISERYAYERRSYCRIAENG